MDSEEQQIKIDIKQEPEWDYDADSYLDFANATLGEIETERDSTNAKQNVSLNCVKNERLKNSNCADILSTSDFDITNIKQELEWENENDIKSALEFELEEIDGGVEFRHDKHNIVKVEQDDVAQDTENINDVDVKEICTNAGGIDRQNGNNVNTVFLPVVVNYLPVFQTVLLRPGNVSIKNRAEFEHNKEKPFRCDVCRRSFKLKTDLARHEKLHSDDTPFSCDICKTSFKLKRYLNSHMIIHSKERPFQCNLCKMEFKRKSYLVKHHKMHVGKRPFHCNICKMGFKSKSCLVRHSKFHFGQKN